jgi:hypothetical protein
MTYSPSIPQDLPPPSVSVDFIRTNFSQYALVFDNNHEALNKNSQGKHTNVILQNQSIDPTITSNFDTFYSKSVISNSSTSEELFVKIPQFLPIPNTNLPMQLTFNSVNNSAPVYQSFIAGGYILYFGQITNAPATITLSPKPKKIVCAIANGNTFTTVGTPSPLDASVLVNANNFQFDIYSTGSTSAPGGYLITWFAIGTQ